MSFNGPNDGDFHGTTPSLFNGIGAATGTSEFGSAALDDSPMAAGLDRVQLRIRELNEDRIARQDDDVRLGRRRSAVARLRRRVAESDEVEASYWDQRRSVMHLVAP
ncbi:MAG: hypothetical protein ACI91O_000343 [Candidatus Poriferisodalaceae bacterium]|jgi:hypothetical protein